MASGINSSLPSSTPSQLPKDSQDDDEIYQLKVALKRLKPPIWRRVLVDGNTSFSTFQHIINKLMGWGGDHLYQFLFDNNRRYISEWHKRAAFDDDEDDMKHLDSKTMTLKDFFNSSESNTIMYEYDLGDSWQHVVTLEKKFARQPGRTYPICIGGRQASPPEHPNEKVHEEWMERVRYGSKGTKWAKFDAKSIIFSPRCSEVIRKK